MRAPAVMAVTAAMIASPVASAELNVVAAGAVRGIVAGMIDDYSKATGLKFNFTVGPTGQLRAALASGRPVDLVIVAAPLLEELERAGKTGPAAAPTSAAWEWPWSCAKVPPCPTSQRPTR
jgi:ABC-type molybdate transport system substrate-binding protein